MIRLLLPAVLAVALAACAAPPPTAGAQEARPDPLPGTRLSIDQLKAQMFHVSAGQRLKPSWPNGAKVAVGFSFDVDNATATLSTGTIDYEIISRGEYGAIDGLPRILRLLDRQQIPASFFIPAVSAILHPQVIKDIQSAKQQHEIGVHGWIHELTTRLTEAEEERLLDQAIAYLTKATGKKPVGYRAPSWAFSGATLDLILKKGFLYDSSLQALDEPYEVMSRGKNTGLVELAIDWTLTETPFLGQNGRMPSPELLYQLYRDEFDGAYNEGTMFVLTLHPYLSGHRAPMKHLEEFVAYMKSKPGVWFATGAQIADYVKTATPR